MALIEPRIFWACGLVNLWCLFFAMWAWSWSRQNLLFPSPGAIWTLMTMSRRGAILPSTANCLAVFQVCWSTYRWTLHFLMASTSLSALLYLSTLFRVLMVLFPFQDIWCWAVCIKQSWFSTRENCRSADLRPQVLYTTLQLNQKIICAGKIDCIRSNCQN